MSNIIFNYTFVNDFTNGINMELLKREILESSISDLPQIAVYNSKVRITFSEELDNDKQAILSSLVSLHNPTNPTKPKINFFPIYPEVRKTRSNNWQTIATFNYQGTNYIGDIDYIDIISKKHKNATSYDVRIIDSVNGTIICETTELTNETYQVNSLGSISNVFNKPSLYEVQIKRNGTNNKWIYIQELNIYHNN